MRFTPMKKLMGIILSGVILSGCSAIPSIPADSVGTLDRAENGSLMVGLSDHPPWTDVSDSGEISGSEVDLVEGFADSINATIDWRIAPESILAGEIKEGELDIVIGGLTDSSPWMTHMALTRPYREADGEKMVMGTRLGENALLVALERYLAEEFGEA